MNAETPEGLFEVVVNDEEQYSIWPIGQVVPAGWRSTGTQGAKTAVLAHIKAVWTDMTPKSLRSAQ